MALFWSPSTSPISPVQCHKNSAISKPFISENLISTINISRISKMSISASPNFSNPNPSLQGFHCCTSSSSSSSIESNKSPFTIIFVKGLPQSTSEGTLNTAFSQFGEVSRVKIVTDKKSKQPLGFAYIWFTSMESAQMAVKEMNGKAIALIIQAVMLGLAHCSATNPRISSHWVKLDQLSIPGHHLPRVAIAFSFLLLCMFWCAFCKTS